MAGNLRSFLHSQGCPSTLADYRTIIDKYFGKNTQGISDESFGAFVESPQKDDRTRAAHISPLTHLDSQVHSALVSFIATGMPISPLAHQKTYIRLNGVQYTTSRSSGRDSVVFFHRPRTGELAAGRIGQIFSHTHAGNEMSLSGTWARVEETYVVLSLFQPVPDFVLDPYAAFPEFGARLYLRKPRGLEIIRVDSIKCHGALHKTDDGYVALRPLDRVSDTYCSTSTDFLYLLDLLFRGCYRGID